MSTQPISASTQPLDYHLNLTSNTDTLSERTSAVAASVISAVPPASDTSMRTLSHEFAPVAKPMGTHVGELQKKWQFPSDHLPIGMTFDGLHILSWNVLDATFMKWIVKKNTQGLSESILADEHVYIGDSQLTIRDTHVTDLILQAISHPTHPRSLLSLQECSEPFIAHLRSKLPAYFEVIANQGRAVCIDKSCFQIIEPKEIRGIFSDKPNESFQEIIVSRRDNGQILRLFNAHVPGNPNGPARFEFANYIAKTFDPKVTTLVMGDMNFNELEVADAMEKAFEKKSPFALYSPYCTNVSPDVLTSKAIDHFFVYSPEKPSVVLSRPNEILPNLEATAALLQ